MSGQRSQAGSTRVSAACRPCRRSKLKCSGVQPCDRCQRRRRECSFDPRDVHETRDPRPESASIARRAWLGNDDWEQRLPDDYAHVASAERPHHIAPTGNPSASPSHPVSDDTHSPNFLRNKPNKRKRWLYLGASSTWSYNIRVAALMRNALGDGPVDTSEGFTLDGDTYALSISRVSTDTDLDLSRLPSIDYAIYLVNTVKFHVGGILRLFDEEQFMSDLHEFYAQRPVTAGSRRLWCTQFLVLLAMGKGFLNGRSSPANTSSVDLFLRAMSILPDTLALHEEPVLAAEVLATIALYFYCLDMRHSAYAHVGQALRLVLVEGLHAHPSAAQIGPKFAERCRNVWWTVYILDRILSSVVGAPISVQDNHIRQPLGSSRASSQRDATLIMHVKLCRVVSFILTELYTTDGSLERHYISKVRFALKRMAEIAQELEETIDFKFKDSLETLSRGALYLSMLYHQDLISTMSNEGHRRADIRQPLQDLIRTCAESAKKILKMLVSLSEHNLLDSFLPFDLEFACSASSVLIMVDEVLSPCDVPPSSKSSITGILNDLAAGGNKAASLRLHELCEISMLAQRLWEMKDGLDHSRTLASQASGQRTIRPQIGDEGSISDPNALPGSSEMLSAIGAPDDNDHLSGRLLSGLIPASTSSSADMAYTFDFPQEQMLSLADHLNEDALPDLLDSDTYNFDEWI